MHNPIPQKPKTFNGDLGALPGALKPLLKLPRWVIWKWEWKENKTGDGKWTKPPYETRHPDRNAANDDPTTWGPYKEAVAAVKKGAADGIGFNLFDGDIGAVDLDNCRDPATGAIAEWATAIVARAPGAYAEVTVSGTGLRIIGGVAVSKMHRKFAVGDGPGSYEVYGNVKRYITLSGFTLDSRGDSKLPNIDKLLDELVAEGDANKKTNKRGRGRPQGSKNKIELPGYLTAILHIPDKGAGHPCGEYATRSDALFGFIKLVLLAGYKDETILGFCQDEKFKGNAIYEHCVENGGEDYILRQIDHASRETYESADGRNKRLVRIITGRLPEATKAVERAIKESDSCPVYRRGRHLVEPLWNLVRDQESDRLVLETWLRPLNVTQLGNLVQKHAIEFQRRDEKTGDFKITDWISAKAVLETLLDLQHQDLPKIKGIITSPTMRHDGSLITADGYDEATELWHHKSPDLELPPIAEKPTRKEAEAALTLLDGLLDEFQFAEDGNNKSVAFAAILTAALRAAFSNAPLLLFTAPEPRTGKSYLCLLISMITTGWPTIPTAGSRNTEEMEKRIETALLGGQQILYLNNLPDGVALSSVTLEQVATEGIVKIRKLGKMEEGSCDCRGATTILINGNNPRMSGALVERTLTCRLDAKMENPGARTFSKKPIELVVANRGAYLAAAFTIARAYMAAGRPKIEATPFAGFDSWSEIVRLPLLWLGVPDPVGTIENARSLDPVRGELRELVDGLCNHIGIDKNFNAATLEIMAKETRMENEGPYNARAVLARPELNAVLVNDRGRIDAKSIGRKLMSFRDRITNGFRIELVSKNEKTANAYRLVWLGEGEPPQPPKRAEEPL